MTINKNIFKMLDELVFLMTVPYCIPCNSVAEKLESGEEICLKCGSYNLSRFLEGYKPDEDFSTFYSEILNRINAHECLVDLKYKSKQDWYEDILNNKYGPINICGKNFSSATTLRTIDNKFFEENMYIYLDDQIQLNKIIKIDEKYYLSHQVEMLIFEKISEIKAERENSLYDFQPLI